MAKKFPLILALIVVFCCCFSCALKARLMKDVSLFTTDVVDASMQTNKKILIYPMTDLRGEYHSYVLPPSYIPGIDLLYMGTEYYYPDYSSIFAFGSFGGSPEITVGSIPYDFPNLFAKKIADKKLTPMAVPISNINLKSTDLSSYDYVVFSKLKKATVTQSINIIPMGILAYLGAPCTFYNMSAEVEIEVFKISDLGSPVLQKTYLFDKTEVAGLYYQNQGKLIGEFFNEVLENATNDLAQAIKS
jgi:hypothetical protein